MDKIVLVDLDGVFADFHGHAMHHFGKTIYDLPPGETWIPKHLGISENAFWKTIDQDVNFWRELPAYPWCRYLAEKLDRFVPGRWYVCTSPARSAQCPAQKIEWIRDHVGGNDFMRFMVGHAKELMAQPGRLLIDDWEKNTAKFIEHGGEAILFPQRWNSRGACVDPVETVLSELKAWLG